LSDSSSYILKVFFFSIVLITDRDRKLVAAEIKRKVTEKNELDQQKIRNEWDKKTVKRRDSISVLGLLVGHSTEETQVKPIRSRRTHNRKYLCEDFVDPEEIEEEIENMGNNSERESVIKRVPDGQLETTRPARGRKRKKEEDVTRIYPLLPEPVEETTESTRDSVENVTDEEFVQLLEKNIDQLGKSTIQVQVSQESSKGSKAVQFIVDQPSTSKRYKKILNVTNRKTTNEADLKLRSEPTLQNENICEGYMGVRGTIPKNIACSEKNERIRTIEIASSSDDGVIQTSEILIPNKTENTVYKVGINNLNAKPGMVSDTSAQGKLVLANELLTPNNLASTENRQTAKGEQEMETVYTFPTTNEASEELERGIFNNKAVLKPVKIGSGSFIFTVNEQTKICQMFMVDEKVLSDGTKQVAYVPAILPPELLDMVTNQLSSK